MKADAPEASKKNEQPGTVRIVWRTELATPAQMRAWVRLWDLLLSDSDRAASAEHGSKKTAG